MTKNVFLILTLLSIISCATEKTNMSPIANSASGLSLVSGEQISTTFNKSVEINTKTSDLSNLCSQIPVFKNDKINSEVRTLKMNIQNYIYAIDAKNKNGIVREQKKVENSYIKIQKLRNNNLEQLENDKLNSFLVKIKRNIIPLENMTTTSTTTKK